LFLALCLLLAPAVCLANIPQDPVDLQPTLALNIDETAEVLMFTASSRCIEKMQAIGTLGYVTELAERHVRLALQGPDWDSRPLDKKALYKVQKTLLVALKKAKPMFAKPVVQYQIANINQTVVKTTADRLEVAAGYCRAMAGFTKVEEILKDVQDSVELADQILNVGVKAETNAKHR
jgi:hypothetical protein